MTNFRRALGPVVAAVAILSGCGAGQPASPPPASAAVTASSSGAAAPASTAGSATAGCDLPPAGGGPGGPAAQDLRGGAAEAGFSLDGGDLVVAPPPAGARPVVSAAAAECDAFASLLADGQYFGPPSAGVAVGLARVTVSPALLAHQAQPTAYVVGSVRPTLPAPQPYQGRLAWVVVTRESFVYPCPLMRSPPKPQPRLASDHGYAVFLLDARTGGDALIYVEGRPAPCGGTGRVAPSVSVPTEQVSVPWTLVSRSPDGYSATIRATVLPCDGYDTGAVLADRARPAARVLVTRPVDASGCGSPKQVTLPLHAATVTSNLPADIAHDPVGVYIPSLAPSSPPSASSSSSSTGVLRNLTDADNGKTVRIHVGDVVAVDPLLGVDHTAPSPVVSSDSGILGPLGAANTGPVAEFRAWRAGAATLSVPVSACHSPDKTFAPCSGPWTVHVVVSAAATAAA